MSTAPQIPEADDAPLSAAMQQAVDDAIAAHQGRPGALLPMLHAVLAALGHVPLAAVPRIAAALDLSRAEVLGVLSFYHDFRTQPPGRTVVKLCRAEACKAVGADALAEHACRRLGVALQQTRADGAVTLEPVYCLGNCACGPAITIDGRMHGRVSPARFDALLERVAPKDPQP
ncbi:MAG: formate dehydrogenase subunit gamma [Nannocystaceae bacterium]|nr:formate dehydrogenase subunit gamma [Nannocystaceae bacterium]